MPFRLLAIAFAMAGHIGAASSAPGPATYALDAAHSQVAVEVALFGSTIQGGFTRRTGSLVAAAAAQSAAVELVLETASVRTGTALFDDQLRGDSFFYAEKYPQARLAIDSLPLAGDGAAVTAKITLRGNSAPVHLQAGPLKCEPGSGPNREACRTVLHGQINLADFEMDSVLPGTPKTAKLTVTIALAKTIQPAVSESAAPRAAKLARKAPGTRKSPPAKRVAG